MIFLPLNSAMVPNWNVQKEGEAIEQGLDDYEEEQRLARLGDFEDIDDIEEPGVDDYEDVEELPEDEEAVPEESAPHPASEPEFNESELRDDDSEIAYEEALKDMPGKRPNPAPREEGGEPLMYDQFKSSNLKSVAYDPEKEQMWIRFLDDSVYTYWDIPIEVWNGFQKAGSKGHYFWETIRHDDSIEYEKLA